MSGSVPTMDDLAMDVVNEDLVIEIDDNNVAENIHTPIVLDSRRRLERCLEDRQLVKELREFDFDI